MLLFDRLLGKNSARSHSPKRFRQMAFDQLEGRELLTTVPVELVVQNAMADLVSMVALPDSGADLATVLELDTWASFGPVEFTPLEAPLESEIAPTEGAFTDEGGEGEWEDQSSPPWIYNFECHFDVGIYTFTGFVIDDGDPFELTIHFGGLLEGATGWVDYDGSFSFSIQLDDPMGVVTATVVDGQGLWSNQAMVYV